MSANNAEPTGEVKNPDEPIAGNNGVDYGSYASEGNIKKATNVDMDFDSKEFEKRQKTEYFVNIEGAERLKREEERRRAAEEKRRIKEINRLSNNTAQGTDLTSISSKEDKQLQKAIEQKKRTDRRQERRTRSAAFIRRTVSNKKIMAILCVVLVLLIVGVIVLIQVLKEESVKQKIAQVEEDYSASVMKSEEIREKYVNDSEFDYDDAVEAYRALVESSKSDVDKIENTIRFSMFVSSYSNDYQLAEETLLSIEEVVSRNPNFYIRYYGELCELYKKSGDVEKYDEAYRKKAEYESQD